MQIEVRTKVLADEVSTLLTHQQGRGVGVRAQVVLRIAKSSET